VLHQVHCVIDTAHTFGMFLRHFRPYEHRSAGFLDFPSDSGQAVTDHVPPGLIPFILNDYILVTVSQGNDTCYLNCLENAVIVIALWWQGN
jgi:hypothetical protein